MWTTKNRQRYDRSRLRYPSEVAPARGRYKKGPVLRPPEADRWLRCWGPGRSILGPAVWRMSLRFGLPLPDPPFPDCL
jgi:hypothetical protein